MVPRAAWIGSSAYTNSKWPGDLSGSFANNGLPSSVHSTLSLAFSGMPFVSTDIGGFANRPVPENVWIRWAQFGAFLPGMQTLHMPWWFSQRAIDHFRYLAWLHTELTPYWMTLANIAHETGAPICRPMIWNYPEDMDCWRADDQFTVGEYILVAPFMNPDNHRNVYLPEGTWHEFRDDSIVHTGPKKLSWFKGYGEKGLYFFPLYIKAGAVLPMEVVNDVTGFGWQGSEKYVTLAVWPEFASENEFNLRDIENVLIKTNWKKESQINISWSESAMDYIFRIHLSKEFIPESVSSGKVKLKLISDKNGFEQTDMDSWYYDKLSQKLWVRKKTGKFNDIRVNLN
jgi:alpha-D-xyloside xylohydrolase